MKEASLRRLAEERDGVSPVIATILMVAMTVVLTAVLYIMVLGLAQTNLESAKWGTITLDSEQSDEFKAVFGEFKPKPRPMKLEIVVEFNETEGFYNFENNEDGYLKHSRGTDVCNINYQDLADDGLISVGDYLTFTNLSPGGEYTVRVLDVETGSVIDSRTIDLVG